MTLIDWKSEMAESLTCRTWKRILQSNPDSLALYFRNPPRPSTSLVVLVHALGMNRDVWQRMVSLAHSDPGFENYDIYAHSYTVNLYRNESILDFGASLADTVEALVHLHHYERIVFVGLHVGGLIIRSAIVHSFGDLEKTPNWACRAARLVLIDTPNSGVRLFFLNSPIAVRLACLGGGQFLIDCLSGSDFITNLRLNWIKQYSKHCIKKPEVLQVRCRPVYWCRGEQGSEVHDKIVNFTASTFDEVIKPKSRNDIRYLHLRDTITARYHNIPGMEANKPVQQPSAIVFLLHGIRDFGHWTKELEADLKKIDENILVVRRKYGYFNLYNFVLRWRRERMIRWFCDQYTTNVSKWDPECIPFHFVAHSYGTYIIAEGLHRFPQMKFQRGCFVGSVIPCEYDWSLPLSQRRQLDRLLNVGASKDWIVGVGCAALRGLGYKDLGIAGIREFHHSDEALLETLIPGGHSDALRDKKCRRDIIIEFILNGTPHPKLI